MIADLHNDLLTSKLNVRQRTEYLNNAFESGLKKVILAVWATKEYCSFERVMTEISVLPGVDRSRLLYSIEDLHFVNEKNIHKISMLPLSACTLTWNNENALGGGALSDAGLTKLGAEVLKKMKTNSIALDTAHLNKKTFFDAVEKFDGRIINSHTCFDGVYSHPRNITDEQINLIIQRGGIIGLTIVPAFLTEKKATSIEDVARHIDYFVSTFGDSNLCFGTDYFGTDAFPENLQDYSGFSVLGGRLKKLGYSQKSINNLFFGNFERFFM